MSGLKGLSKTGDTLLIKLEEISMAAELRSLMVGMLLMWQFTLSLATRSI
ncbi:hypothetical protein [Thalassolituus maritimus]|nr:hypothetical protein [Thalassolituus maritimus]